MTSTADRWFVPDHEYFHCSNDYALVRQPAALVREDLLETDEATMHLGDADDTFLTEYHRTDYEPCYEFAAHGRLVFADVDDEDPTHKEKVYGEWAKEIPAEEESEKAAETKKVIIKACVDVWFPAGDRSEGGENILQDERERWTVRDLKFLVRNGLLDEPIISHILTAKSVQEKEEILNLMSAQDKRPTKRPVLALINMIDSKQTTQVGETEGWVIGYDFVKELLVIKPFVSKGGNHPLGGKWHGDVAQDGVSFSGTPLEFAKAYVELGNAVEAGNKDNPFKMLVHTIAAKWMGAFGTALVAAYGTEFEQHLLATKEAKEKIKNAMEEIKFPFVEKKKKEPTLAIEPFLHLLTHIEAEEDLIRNAAVDAKAQGHEKIAQNAAKLYESIHKQIKAFNDNPSEDLDL